MLTHTCYLSDVWVPYNYALNVCVRVYVWNGANVDFNSPMHYNTTVLSLSITIRNICFRPCCCHYCCWSLLLDYCYYSQTPHWIFSIAVDASFFSLWKSRKAHSNSSFLNWMYMIYTFRWMRLLMFVTECVCVWVKRELLTEKQIPSVEEKHYRFINLIRNAEVLWCIHWIWRINVNLLRFFASK